MAGETSRPAVVRLVMGVVRPLTRWSIAAVGLTVALVAALVQRYRRRPEKPRIFWGAEPLINMKYHSRAAKLEGYDSATVVDAVYAIHRSEDFDYVASELARRLFPPVRLLPAQLRLAIEPFVTFVWALGRFDVFVIYASSTILRHTSAKYLELQLLRLARKKVVLLAYGGDVQATTRMPNLLFKHALMSDYPDYARRPEQVIRDLHYCSRHADHIMAGVDWVDYMPWWDSLNAGHFAIDTDAWTPAPASGRDEGGPVRVLHAPNHPEVKGTRFLVEACEELKGEGVPIELEVVRGVPNERMRELMSECDIVADQFIVGWYALFAIEAMALGKPVLCYLRPDLLELYTLHSFAGECPLVNTPPTRIKEVLRELAGDAERRRELGLRGRRYVEDHHSLRSAGRMFDEIFRELY